MLIGAKVFFSLQNEKAGKDFAFANVGKGGQSMQMSVCRCDANPQNRKTAKQQFALKPKTFAVRQSISNIFVVMFHICKECQKMSKIVVDVVRRRSVL